MANEKRLIDRDALLAELDKFANPMPNKSGYDFLCGIATAITEIENAPTVQAVEVVHAEWACVNESENVWMCTGDNGCGGEMIILEQTPLANGFRFCPYCGAKMDGGNEDG